MAFGVNKTKPRLGAGTTKGSGTSHRPKGRVPDSVYLRRFKRLGPKGKEGMSEDLGHK